MTISPKALADRQRGSLPTKIITTVTKALGPARLDAGIIGGIDIDPYLGSWNADIAKLNGAQFVFVEVDEYFAHPQFDNSWMGAKGVLPRAAYRFLMKDPNWSIHAQADAFANHFPTGYNGELPLILDLEEDKWYGNGKNKEHLSVSDAVAFCIYFKQRSPSWNGEVMIYSGFSWLKNFGGIQFFQNPLPSPITKAYLYISNPPPTLSKYNPPMGKLPQPEFIQTGFAYDGIFYGGTSKGVDGDAYVGHSFDDILRKG